MSDSGRDCGLQWEIKGSPSCLGFRLPLHPGTSSWKASQITYGSRSHPCPQPCQSSGSFSLIVLLQPPLISRTLLLLYSSLQTHASQAL